MLGSQKKKKVVVKMLISQTDQEPLRVAQLAGDHASWSRGH